MRIRQTARKSTSSRNPNDPVQNRMNKILHTKRNSTGSAGDAVIKQQQQQQQQRKQESHSGRHSMPAPSTSRKEGLGKQISSKSNHDNLIYDNCRLFQFGRILAGVFGIAVTVATALFGMNKIPQASDLRSKYPFAIYVVGAFNVMILYSTLRPIMFLGLVVLIPFLGWVVHASVRSRSIKNKVSNKVEQITGGQVYSNTPMGYALVTLGFEARDHEE